MTKDTTSRLAALVVVFEPNSGLGDRRHFVAWKRRFEFPTGYVWGLRRWEKCEGFLIVETLEEDTETAQRHLYPESKIAAIMETRLPDNESDTDF